MIPAAEYLREVNDRTGVGLLLTGSATRNRETTASKQTGVSLS